ncbi:hypothetical protein M2403_004533 [Rahnella sp. BIGb0603]|uniref:hypothetical protein n=1 Tax=Rahnella sp. BIGb0603 TaxID=2940612 RepID=UPI0021677E12|nr:hypothetical protein [Rahnella sp. BIGb0603]MCS3425900.1 hypothetical protein [Rahnella sp. BIGb0603]
MTTLFSRRNIAKILSAPSEVMQSVISSEIKQSNDSKIITDTNGNATLNMENQQVRNSMRARMEELANRR